MWSPFYAKINTFNKIFYFDWLFGAGLTSVTTLDNRNEFSSSSPDADELTQETVTGFTWMTGWRFYINKNWSLRMDFVATHMNVEMANSSATDTEKRLDNKYNFNMGLNFAF